MGTKVVSSCGAEAYTAGSKPAFAEMDTTGAFCVSASVTASITGFPGSAQSTGTPITVTTVNSTGTLPAGTVVVASNIGPTNTAMCKLGNTATVNDQAIPPNSWFAFTVGTATQISCITSASGTTVNLVGGAGLPTGAGGGGGGGGSTTGTFDPTTPARWGLGVIGATVPTTAAYVGINVGGNLVGWGGSVVLSPGTAAVGTVDPSTPGRWAIGATAAAVPASAFYVGLNTGGNLVGWTGTISQSSSPWNSRTQDGSGNGITSDARGGERPLSVQILDASGNQITTFGGAGGTASNFNALFPTAGTATGFMDSTTTSMTYVKADISHNMNVDIAAGLNANGQALMINSAPVVIASDQSPVKTSTTSYAGGTLGPMANYGTSPGAVLVPGVNAFVTNNPSSEYPSGAVPFTVGTSGTTAVISLTLSSASGKTAFMCSYSYRVNATSALTSALTVTGVLSGPAYYAVWVAPLANAIGINEQVFSPCIPASAQNTNIVLTSPAPGSGGFETLAATGYVIAGNGY